jgi:DNA-binding MarR family transcriptional regulator
MKSKVTSKPGTGRKGKPVARQNELREIAIAAEQQLNIIHRAMRQQFRAEVERGNLTGPQRLVMSVVVRHDGISLKDLSAAVSLAHSTVSGIVDRLEKQGYIERQSGVADRRLTMLAASKPVREFLNSRVHELAMSPLMEALGRTDRVKASEILAALQLLSSLLTLDESASLPDTGEFEAL